MTTTVGFVGLGIMGGPMAANLVKAGFEVIGHNRSPEPVRRLEAASGRGAATLAEAVRDAEVIVTMLPDSPDVEAVALGQDGIYATARPGALHVDMSTIRPEVARRPAGPGRARRHRGPRRPASRKSPRSASRPRTSTTSPTTWPGSAWATTTRSCTPTTGPTASSRPPSAATTPPTRPAPSTPGRGGRGRG